MNVPVPRRFGQPASDQAAGNDSGGPSLTAEMQGVAAVAAHGALNSLAFILGALTVLQQGAGIDPEEEEQLLSRAVKHTGTINALLRDLVLGLPIGLTAMMEDRPTRNPTDRFGVGRGVGVDSMVEIRPSGVHPPQA